MPFRVTPPVALPIVAPEVAPPAMVTVVAFVLNRVAVAAVVVKSQPLTATSPATVTFPPMR